jgi:cytochrome c553
MKRFEHRVSSLLRHMPLIAMLLAAPSSASEYVDLRTIEPIRGDASAGEPKATVCFACHGPNGNSIVPTFPRLAGQKADYLFHRLVAFKHSDPKDPYFSQSPMPAQVAELSEADMQNLAAYFASQKPAVLTPVTAAPGASKGEALFRDGDPSRGIPPCAGCHGADANGIDADGQYLAWPALRGQHAAYVSARLKNFRNNLPNGTSNDFIMQNVAHTLDDDAIDAIAAYLDSLAPGVAR